MARNLILMAAILAAGVSAVSTAQARLGWTMEESVRMYGPYKTAMQNLPGYLPGTVYGFFDKTADVDHQQPDCVLESYLDGKVGLISYANSDHTPISERSIEIALLLNAPEAEWTVREKYYVGKVSGKIKYMGELHDAGWWMPYIVRMNTAEGNTSFRIK